MKIKKIEINGGYQQFADDITVNNFSIIDNKAQIHKLIEKYASDSEKKELLESLENVCNESVKLKKRKKMSEYIHTFLNTTIKEFGKEIITQGFNFIN